MRRDQRLTLGIIRKLEADGVEVERLGEMDCSAPPRLLDNSGYASSPGAPPLPGFSRARSFLALRSPLHPSPNQSCKTEAEAVAFVVCQAIGLETGTASADYIQLWRGDADLLHESLEAVQQTAAVILGGIAPEPAAVAAYLVQPQFKDNGVPSPMLSPCADAIASPGKKRFWPSSSMQGMTTTGVPVTTLHPARVCPSSARTRLATFDPFR